MGKGPGTIYKDCIAIAIRKDRELAKQSGKEDIQREINLNLCCCTMFEKDVRRIFFEQNYSDKSTERALKQWADLELVSRYPYKGYRFVAFLDAITYIEDNKSKGGVA